MPVHVDVTSPLATVRLDQPERHDAFVLAEWRALADTFAQLSERSDVACVVVRGTGGRALSPQPLLQDSEAVRAYAEAIATSARRVLLCPHPTVAIVEGLCTGGGLEIAASCDLRVCGESTRFGWPIDRSAASYGDLEPLERLLGGSSVLERLLAGELIDAGSARRAGLVNRVHPDRAVLQQGYGLAARVAAGAPLVNRWHKSVVRQLLARTPD